MTFDVNEMIYMYIKIENTLTMHWRDNIRINIHSDKKGVRIWETHLAKWSKVHSNCS